MQIIISSPLLSLLLSHSAQQNREIEEKKGSERKGEERDTEEMAEDTLASLRSLMASHSPPLHALVVPSEDYHQVSLSLSLIYFGFDLLKLVFLEN